MQKENSEGIDLEGQAGHIDEENGVSEDDDNVDLESSELYQLETQFQAKPNVEIAAKLVKIYQELEDSTNVRRIRETLLENANLTEEQWLDWLNDEYEHAKSDEEYKEVLKLCERALDENLFIEVGELCADYAEKLFKAGVLRKRGVEIYLEKLISHFCNDFNNGSVFFEKFRKFIDQNAEKKEDAVKQKRNLFARQLKLPLADIMVTWDEYEKFEKDQAELEKNKKCYEEVYEGIIKYLDLDEKFSQVLESKKLKDIKNILDTIIGKDYLTVERKLNYFSRIFDAGINDKEIWTMYIDFSKENIKSNVGLEKVYYKAYKNNQSDINIALSYLRTMEKSGSEIVNIESKKYFFVNFEEKIFGMFTKFTNIHEFYLLWLFIYEVNARFINRKLSENKYEIATVSSEVQHFREFAQKGLDFFASFDPNQAINYTNTLLLFWANIETYTFRDKGQMNHVMEKYIHLNGVSFHAWNQYITFEQVFGKVNAIRTLIKRLLEVCKDDFHTLYNYAIEFERKFGSIEELEAMEQKYKDKIAKIKGPEIIIADDLTIREEIPELKSKGLEQAKKRKYDEHARNVTEGSIEEQEHLRDNKLMKIEGRKPVFTDKKNTVFVKNLPFSFTEPDIQALFANAGSVTSVRIVRDKTTGMAKGLAYVDFADEESAKSALETNGISVDGRKLFVALSDPPKKGKQDEKTIFLNSLSFSTDEAKIKEHFSAYADDIEDVRVIRDAQGKPKGYAYLTMKSNEKAVEVVEKQKNLILDGKKFSMQIADSNKHFEQVAKASLVIFIKKLGKDVNEKDLEDYFKDYKIKQIHLVRDKESKKSKCFGFIEFNDLFNFKRALELQNPRICGQEVIITKSERPITADMDDDQDAPKKKKNALSKRDAVDHDSHKIQEEPKVEETQNVNNIKKLNFVPSSMPKITVVKKAEAPKSESEKKEATPAPKSQNQFRSLLKKN